MLASRPLLPLLPLLAAAAAGAHNKKLKREEEEEEEEEDMEKGYFRRGGFFNHCKDDLKGALRRELNVKRA